MPDSGANLGADLFELYCVGKDHLPALADEYMTASRFVGDPSVTIAWALSRHPDLGGEKGPAYAPWFDLCNEVTWMLSNTARNLDDTALALLLAVNEYSATDAAAKAELDSLVSAHRGPR